MPLMPKSGESETTPGDLPLMVTVAVIEPPGASVPPWQEMLIMSGTTISRRLTGSNVFWGSVRQVPAVALTATTSTLRVLKPYRPKFGTLRTPSALSPETMFSVVFSSPCSPTASCAGAPTCTLRSALGCATWVLADAIWMGDRAVGGLPSAQGHVRAVGRAGSSR